MENEYSPVFIGGIGGSGTRVFAGVLEKLGYFMGGNCNPARDTLWFKLLLPTKLLLHWDEGEFLERSTVLVTALSGGTQNDLDPHRVVKLCCDSASEFAKRSVFEETLDGLLVQLFANKVMTQKGWGWKAPKSHLWAEPLLNAHKNLRFLYVLRNGFDMISSANRNQDQLLETIYKTRRSQESEEYLRLRAWYLSLVQAERLLAKYPSRVLIVRLEDLLQSPSFTASIICKFVGLKEVPVSLGSYLKTELNPLASSRGAHLRETMSIEPDIKRALRELGYWD